MEITLDQLKSLLNEQKRLVLERVKSHSYYYNKESTNGHLKSLPIDNEKLEKLVWETDYPNDVNVLSRYIVSVKI